MAAQQPLGGHVEVFCDAHPTATTSLQVIHDAEALLSVADVQDASSTLASAAQPTGHNEVVMAEVVLHMRYKWAQQSFDISIAESDTVGDLKALIFSQTTVPPERQKIIGLAKSKLSDDDVTIAQLQLHEKASKEFTVIGTPLGKEFTMKLLVGPSERSDEPHADERSALKTDDPALKRRNARKLLDAVNRLDINIMNVPREGKKLLVLDLDYTILDSELIIARGCTFRPHAWKSQNFHAIDYMRPVGILQPTIYSSVDSSSQGMHDFLEAVYPYYDIVIWSQTSWMWLESKLIELGMVGDDSRGYKISFVLDRAPMFSVYSVRHGQSFKHEVKALEIIWKKFPAFYNSTNSIHIDDLGRNFALNPQQGLKISAYRDASKARNTDRELPALARYLVAIGALPNLQHLDHSKWKAYSPT